MRILKTDLVLNTTLAFLCCLGASSLVNGATLDAPHDTQGCSTCHDMTAFDQQNLIPGSDVYVPLDIDDTINNYICLGCHNGAIATEAFVHSSQTTGSTDHGGSWSVPCSVCHNQHSQEQDHAFGTTLGGLVRRTIDLSKIAGAGYTGHKNVTFTAATGANSYADGNMTYDGICEVCHTQTKYHQNTSAGNHTHYVGQNCITCHSHASGFIHGGGGGGDCITCHGHDAGFEYEPGKFSQGTGTFKSHSAHTENDVDDSNGPNITCTVCHDTADFPFFISGTDSNGDNKFILSETNVCEPCHNDGTGISTGSLILKTPPAWNTISLTCTSCHTIGPAYANGSPKANSHSAHSAFSCSTCHASTTYNGTDINDQSVHPNGSYTLQADAGITFSYTFNAAGGTCTNISCHGSQNAIWGATLSCDSCHSYPPVPGDGKDINEVSDGGKGAHVTSWDTTGAFGRGGHIIYPDGLNPVADIYGDTSTGYNECYKCHKNGTHADGTVDVMISGDPWSTVTGTGPYDRPSGFGLFGAPDYLGVPGDPSTPKTCFNIICHQGDTPRWSCPGGE